MEYRQTVQNVLAEFGKNIGLEPLALGEEGYCRIQVDDTLEVNLELDEESGSLLLLSPIAPAKPELFADALELNMLRKQLAGARFVLIREANIIALLKHLQIEKLTLPEFEAQFEQFISIAQNWVEAFSENEKKEEKKDLGVPHISIGDITNRA